MRTAVFLLGLVLLAGCSGSPSTPATSTAPSSGTPATAAAVAPSPPTVQTLTYSFDGTLGTFAHGCVFPVGICQTQVVAQDTTDFFVERPGGNLTTLSFDVTWQAQTPTTGTLTVGAMVMASCDGCNSTSFGEATGTSPLHMDVQGVRVALTDQFRVHLYVYNPTGVFVPPGGAGYAVVGVAQAIHLEGTATVLVPAGSAPLTGSVPAS